MQTNLSGQLQEYSARHRRKKRLKKLVLALSCVVIFCTSYALILPALTMTDETFCGLEEHQHSLEAGCYERTLVCTLQENTPEADFSEPELASDGNASEESHVHTDACYEEVLVCTMEEHQHTLACYSNPEADLESSAVWERTLPTCTGNAAEDLAAAAESQLGYCESTKNYQVADSGELCGYTRYGDWLGDPYGDWNAAFASFCLHYAGVSESIAPQTNSCTVLANAMAAAGCYTSDLTAPQRGNLVFLDTGDYTDGLADRVGIVTGVDEQRIYIVEGDVSGCVRQSIYYLSDSQILGYSLLSSEDDLAPTAPVEDPTEDTPVPLDPEDLTPSEEDETLENSEDVEAAEESEDAADETSSEDADSASEIVLSEVEISLNAQLYTDASYTSPLENGTVITVTGFLPEQAEIRAYPVQIETELELLCAYDLSIFLPDGTLYEPEDGNILTVSISAPELIGEDPAAAEETAVYYVPEFGEPQMLPSEAMEGSVTFETNHFSVYALARATGVRNANSLKAAFSSAVSSGSGSIQLSADITLDSQLVLNQNAAITLDLNGHRLTCPADTAAFAVSAGTLTITDSVPDSSTGSNAVTFSYETVTSTVTNAATGATQETSSTTTVTTSGYIQGSNSPIVELSGGTLEIAGGLLYGGTGRAIVQTGGTVAFSGGYIYGFTESGSETDNTRFGGAIKITGGTFNLSGGVLAGNTAQNGGAIYATDAVINISAGVISGNTANRTTSGWNAHSESGAYRCGGGGIYTDGATQVNFSGGYLTCNTAVDTGYFDGGGGIFLSGTSSMTITGGYITGNTAQGGGGVRADFGKETTLTMTGGFVSGNTATTAEGGGMAIDRSGLGNITGGYITNNRITNTVHWGGGGLFCADGSTLYVKNVLITENTAGGFGAGIAGCPTGNLYVYITEGSAIYDNRDMVNTDSPHYVNGGVKDGIDAARCDAVFLANGHSDYFCAMNSTVTSTMLGGYATNWSGSADGSPVIADSEDVLTASSVMGLQAAPSEAGKQAAQAAAHVYINGNYSYTHGGGIMCNGNLIIGTPDDVEVPARIDLQATKQLLDGSGNAQNLDGYEFHFRVTMTTPDGTVIASGASDSSGAIDFNAQLTFKESGTFVYYVSEEADTEDSSIQYDTTQYRITVNVVRDDGVTWYADTRKYTYQVTRILVESSTDGQNWTTLSEDNTLHSGVISLPLTKNASFINRLVDVTSLTVKKEWSDGTPGADTVTVILKQDGTEIDRQTLSSANGWTYTWSDLASGHSYNVEEEEISGYTASYRVEVSTEEDGSTSVGKGSWWVPATELKAGQQYLIVSADGSKALYITQAHQNAGFTNADVASVTQQMGTLTVNGASYSTWYEASAIDSRSIFTAQQNQKTGGSGLILKCNGTSADTWLLVQGAGNNHLKGTSGNRWSSIITYQDGLLKGHENYDWNPSDLRTFIFDSGSGKFNTTKDSSPANAVKLYTLVNGDATSYSSATIIITNTRNQQTSYELPETGGPGSLLFTAGGLLFLAAGLLYGTVLWRKKGRRFPR